jgi:hypothetical protein
MSWSGWAKPVKATVASGPRLRDDQIPVSPATSPNKDINRIFKPKTYITTIKLAY